MCAAISSLGEELKIGPNQEISIGSKIFAVRGKPEQIVLEITQGFFLDKNRYILPLSTCILIKDYSTPKLNASIV